MPWVASPIADEVRPAARVLAMAGHLLSKRGYQLEVEDRFETEELDQQLWLPHHLPQWSSREQSAARYRVDSGQRLLIERDQQPWCAEFDGRTRVSSLQTGVFSGPVGSHVGQHHFRRDLRVREAQPAERLYTPQYGLFEARASAVADPANMVALWMIGYEDEPQHSAEICIFETFGRDVGRQTAVVGMGIHPFADPALADDFSQQPLSIDARQPHDYSIEWLPGRVDYFVDGRLVKTSNQAPDYPMQFMLGIYEFQDGEVLPSPATAYPKEFVVERFAGYRQSA